MIGDRPADHSSGVRVEHRRQIDLALHRRMLGDVAHPEGIGTLDAELSADEVIL